MAWMYLPFAAVSNQDRIFQFTMSEVTRKACRNLVNFFNSSLLATTKLFGKQVKGRSVKPIQDVMTKYSDLRCTNDCWKMRVT